jgi:hypothetical protein
MAVFLQLLLFNDLSFPLGETCSLKSKLWDSISSIASSCHLREIPIPVCFLLCLCFVPTKSSALHSNVVLSSKRGGEKYHVWIPILSGGFEEISFEKNYVMSQWEGMIWRILVLFEAISLRFYLMLIFVCADAALVSNVVCKRHLIRVPSGDENAWDSSSVEPQSQMEQERNRKQCVWVTEAMSTSKKRRILVGSTKSDDALRKSRETYCDDDQLNERRKYPVVMYTRCGERENV